MTEIINREEEEEREELSNTIPPSDIVAFNELRSCADIYRMYAAGQLDINPDFQRGEVWNPKEQTLFIDSLIKQLPIPSLCISWDFAANKRLVVDGLQRISTIIKFLNPTSEWRLSNTKEVDERIAGKNIAQIKEIDNNRLFNLVENVTIPITIIRCDYSKKDHMQYLFQIFSRLNSGGKKLYYQEIRNCVYSGTLNTLLKNLARCDSWLKYAETEIEKVEKARFSNEERILRFFAFYKNYTSYNGRLASFLNNYMEDNKDLSEGEIIELNTLFVNVFRILNEISIKSSSRYIDDALFVGIANNIDKLMLFDLETLKNRIQDVLALPEFSMDTVNSDTSAKDKVVSRIQASIDYLSYD